MEDKIREVIEVVKACTPVKIENQSITVDMLRDGFNCLVELAERYLSVGKDMPEKFTESDLDVCRCTACNECIGDCKSLAINQTIEECTLVTTKLLAEKNKEIAELDKENQDLASELQNFCLGCVIKNNSDCRDKGEKILREKDAEIAQLKTARDEAIKQYDDFVKAMYKTRQFKMEELK